MKRRHSHSRHVTATMTVERPTPGDAIDGIYYADIELTITGIAHPGCPETPRTFACGGEPAEPPSVEDVVARTIDGKVFQLTDDEMVEAEEVLLEQEPEEETYEP